MSQYEYIVGTFARGYTHSGYIPWQRAIVIRSTQRIGSFADSFGRVRIKL